MRILLIEDSETLMESLKYQLVRDGIMVDGCLNGADADYYIGQHIYDLIILDRMLPGKDGLTLLEELRRNGDETPVLMLTALDSLKDRIQGLNLGADDYLGKPFAYEELLARIYCIARRPRKIDTGEILSFGDISLRCADFFLKGSCNSCSLSVKEGQLLEIFLRNPGQTLSRNLLFNRIWGPESDVEDGNLDNYIYFLRRRLQAVSEVVSLKTIRGIGYHLEECLGKQ